MNIDPRDLPERVGEVVDEALSLPLQSLTKREIDFEVDRWLESVTNLHSDSDTFVFLKQMEQAVKTGIEKMKERAFNAFSNGFRGEMKGVVLGHEVKLTYPEIWVYSPAVKALQDQQKLELEALQAEEKAKGLANKEPQLGRITVTLRTK